MPTINCGKQSPNKLAMFSDFCLDVGIGERLELIKEAGFGAVMLNTNDGGCDIKFERQLRLCEKNNLRISCVHLPFDSLDNSYTANDIWQNENRFFDKIASDLVLCGQNGINIAVLHLTFGPNAPQPNETGFERMRKLCSIALRNNVKLALENRRNTPHIEEVFTHVNSQALALCYDIGPEAVYQKNMFEPQRLAQIHPAVIVHIHDNNGKKDDHMLPFDGTVDFNAVAKQMKAMNYQGDVLLEPRKSYSKQYQPLSPREFIHLAYEKATVFQKLFNNLP